MFCVYTEMFTQEPAWDCEVDFTVPEGEERAVNIEVFDADKFGKDKSLGKDIIQSMVQKIVFKIRYLVQIAEKLVSIFCFE